MALWLSVCLSVCLSLSLALSLSLSLSLSATPSANGALPPPARENKAVCVLCWDSDARQEDRQTSRKAGRPAAWKTDYELRQLLQKNR